jgi:hypothetical protein
LIAEYWRIKGVDSASSNIVLDYKWDGQRQQNSAVSSDVRPCSLWELQLRPSCQRSISRIDRYGQRLKPGAAFLN